MIYFFIVILLPNKNKATSPPPLMYAVPNEFPILCANLVLVMICYNLPMTKTFLFRNSCFQHVIIPYYSNKIFSFFKQDRVFSLRPTSLSFLLRIPKSSRLYRSSGGNGHRYLQLQYNHSMGYPETDWQRVKWFYSRYDIKKQI